MFPLGFSDEHAQTIHPACLDAALADLHERLARTRLPDEPPLAPWTTGTCLAYLRSLTDYWQNDFDWLLLSHGWPCSVFEFLEIVRLLTERVAVAAHKLPGYTLSFKPANSVSSWSKSPNSSVRSNDRHAA
ncbi:epoxide hydrolase N-terminal domain-containing protein [Rhodococcus sp. NPDC057014]|uniref:epoxide hydrolase N-terminal domain-containing protein n=1 Tax=Rhodococcus sp. NPDC057014 TaxID=3346000 RepID=UPI00363D791F